MVVDAGTVFRVPRIRLDIHTIPAFRSLTFRYFPDHDWCGEVWVSIAHHHTYYTNFVWYKYILYATQWEINKPTIVSITRATSGFVVCRSLPTLSLIRDSRRVRSARGGLEQRRDVLARSRLRRSHRGLPSVDLAFAVRASSRSEPLGHSTASPLLRRGSLENARGGLRTLDLRMSQVRGNPRRNVPE